MHGAGHAPEFRSGCTARGHHHRAPRPSGPKWPMFCSPFRVRSSSDRSKGKEMTLSKVKSWRYMIAPLSLLVASACASAPPPTDKMASVEASIRAARDLGSQQVPSSQESLKRAEDELTRA